MRFSSLSPPSRLLRLTDVPHPTDRLSKYTAPRRLALGLVMGAAAGGAVDLRDYVRAQMLKEE